MAATLRASPSVFIDAYAESSSTICCVSRVTRSNGCLNHLSSVRFISAYEE